MRTVVIEIFQVMGKKGVKVPFQGADDYFDFFLEKQLPPAVDHCYSMLQDIKLCRRTEIDALNGAISQYVKEMVLATPYNDFLTHLINFKEKMKDWKGLKPPAGEDLGKKIRLKSLFCLIRFEYPGAAEAFGEHLAYRCYHLRRKIVPLSKLYRLQEDLRCRSYLQNRPSRSLKSRPEIVFHPIPLIRVHLAIKEIPESTAFIVVKAGGLVDEEISRPGPLDVLEGA